MEKKKKKGSNQEHLTTQQSQIYGIYNKVG